MTLQRGLRLPIWKEATTAGRWCYPSNAGEQTLSYEMLNQQNFFATRSRQSITWIALPDREPDYNCRADNRGTEQGADDAPHESGRVTGICCHRGFSNTVEAEEIHNTRQ